MVLTCRPVHVQARQQLAFPNTCLVPKFLLQRPFFVSVILCFLERMGSVWREIVWLSSVWQAGDVAAGGSRVVCVDGWRGWPVGPVEHMQLDHKGAVRGLDCWGSLQFQYPEHFVVF